MDILTHAIVGAVTGSAFGQPVAGAIAAVAADLPIARLQRLHTPPALYRFTHSGLALLVLGVFCTFAKEPSAGAAVFFGYLSHIVLDLPTHAREWQPRLLWPRSSVWFPNAVEWEWFNKSWFLGLGIAIIWSAVCIL